MVISKMERSVIMAKYGSTGMMYVFPVADIDITLSVPWFVRG